MFAELISGQPLWPGRSDLDQLYLIRKTLGIFLKLVNNLSSLKTNEIITVHVTTILSHLNPLTPGAFCKKMHFLDILVVFLGWISAKLALLWLKMHLQHDSLPFLLLASRFRTFELGHAQESKVTYVFRLFDF